MNQIESTNPGAGARASLAFLRGAILMVATAAALTVSAAEPVQVGPTVNVTAAREAAKTPAEIAYVDTLFRKLQRASRYPTGREASLDRPSGTATVWADVARDGRVKGRGIEQSSGSAMLDGTARALIGRSRFPAFGAGDWDGAPTHRFVVSYAFDGVAMTAGKTAAR